MESQDNYIIENYKLLGELGGGGFAKVFKAQHGEFNYIRAIKILERLITDKNDKTYQNFVRECNILRHLGDGNHPNIVHIYEHGLDKNRAFIVMDFVDGKDLREYLVDNERFLPIEEVMRLMEQISSALAYCHSKGVKHNDIHSGNIMRRENGEFVMLDFGLAINGDEVVRSSSRTEHGAPEYKAPEKWENEKNLTEGSDIYSFGIVLYEYLAGRVPFPSDPNANITDDNYRLKNAHTKTHPPEIFKLRESYYRQTHHGKDYQKDYPDWLEKAILICLEKDPNNRFHNGKELYEYVKKRMKKWEEQKAEEALKDLKDKIKELEKKLQKAYRDIEDQREKIEILEKENRHLFEENKNLREKLDHAKAKINKLEEEIKRLINSGGSGGGNGGIIQKLQEELEKAKKKIVELEHEIRLLHEELDSKKRRLRIVSIIAVIALIALGLLGGYALNRKQSTIIKLSSEKGQLERDTASLRFENKVLYEEINEIINDSLRYGSN